MLGQFFILGFSEDRTRSMGIRQRVFPPRREAVALRDSPSENLADASNDRGDSTIGAPHKARRIAGQLRGRAGHLLDLLPLRRADSRRRADRAQGGERPASAREQEPVPGVVPDEEPVQQHPAAHVQVRSQLSAQRSDERRRISLDGGGGAGPGVAGVADGGGRGGRDGGDGGSGEEEEEEEEGGGVLDEHEAFRRLDRVQEEPRGRRREFEIVAGHEEARRSVTAFDQTAIARARNPHVTCTPKGNKRESLGIY